MIRPLVLSMVALSLGCGGDRRDPVIKAARGADQIWRARADPGGLENALEAYQDLNTRFPDDSRVLWRLARLHTLLGDRDPDSAIRHYGAAKEIGLECLMLQPSFAGLVTSRGGQVPAKAAAELGEEDRECLVWTVIAWSRWVGTRGPAGVGLDLAPIKALGNRSVEVAGNWGSGRAYHAQALALSLPPPSLGPDFVGAKAACDKAFESAPGRLVTRVDCAEFVLAPMGDPEAADAILRQVAQVVPADGDAELLEDRLAVSRACRLLGLPEPSFGEAELP
jgi:hypothetical protein